MAALTLALGFATGAAHAQTLGSNLALTGPSAGADGSGFDNTKLVRDGDVSTASKASGTSNQRVSVKWGSAVTFNTVILRESGSNITSWQLVDNDTGAVLATGTGIGAQRQVSLGTVSTKKLNLIVNATSAPSVAEIEVYNATGVTSSSVASSSVVSSSKPASSVASSAPVSSIPASSAAAQSSAAVSSVPNTGGQQCNWYGQGLWPVCVTTVSGWGWENNASCIAAATCSAQPAPYGIVGATSSVAASSVPSSSSSIPSSSSKSSAAPSSTPVSSSSSSSSKSSVVSSSVASSVVSSSVPASSSSSASSVDITIRPAKIEGFAAHANVTGGQGGREVTVSTGTELNAALCSRGSVTEPIVIKVNGTISHANTTAQGCNTQADVIEIKQMSNVSIIGVGTNALFEEIGIHVRDASNVIIQNVHIRNVKKSGSPTSNGGDAIGMETNVDRVWVDHNWLEASGGEKDGYDSLLDMKAGVTNVTVSYNLFNDSSRAGLIGSSDSDDANTNITFHHNWYKNIEQRTPLIRHALVHMYNNYWSNTSIDYMFHAINSRMNAKALVESNYFYNVNNPLIASDDSDVAGCWQTNNDNTVLPSIYYSRTVGNGALVIPAVVNGQLQSTCSVSVPYSVQKDAAANVPAIVMANAGVGKIGNVVTTSSVAASSKAASSVAVSSVVASSSKSSVASSAPRSSSSVASSIASSKASSSSSSVVIVDDGTISADCIRLATNPSVNWRDTSLQTDQEIVSCLSKTLGKPVGYGENAKGGFDPNGNSKLTIITKNSSTSVEQQILTAITGEAHNWIVFDKIQFAQPHEIGMYRLGCSNPTVQSLLGATEAECVNYTQWCAKNGVSSANCVTQFFNTAMNKSNNPIRNPVVGSNKTIDGRGSEAYFLFSGFAIGKDSTGTPTQTANSVIMTHLKFQGAGHTEDHYCDPDMIRSTGASKDIWIHKNTFDTTGDSAFDVKVGAHNVTMSFNRLVNVKRAVLHGSSDSHTIDTQITTTMHNNAFVTTDDSYTLLGNTLRRVPLLRHGKTHMFNNVFVNYRNQILSLRVGASALMEDSVFMVNAVHQEKSTVEASLAEISANLFKDISGGSFRNDRNFLWFGDSACNLTGTTKTTLTATNGSVANLANNYNAASQATINNWRFAAGQELVDYVSATAGKHGQIPYNSPLAGDKYYVLGLGKVACQNR
jgi:pectate lyase